MMHMTFYWSRYVTILFDSWRTNTWLEYWLSLIAVFLAGLIVEYLSNRLSLAKSLTKSTAAQIEQAAFEVPLLRIRADGRRAGLKLLQTLLFAIRTALAFLLMLAVMSFNGGVFLSIVAGLSVGFFIFQAGNDIDPVAESNHCSCV